VPAGVKVGCYRVKPPLIKRSGITGWAVNFAVGCTHGCIFCYADYYNKAFPRRGLEELVEERWGYYFATPVNLGEAIAGTKWHRWAGVEVFMSSMHDPYLPQLAVWARRILERALPAGVKVIVHTRSVLVARDLDLLARHSGNVRLHMSIATMNTLLSKLIEPRVPPPHIRIKVLGEARAKGIRTGVSISPVFPPNKYNPDVYRDLLEIAKALAEAGVEVVYGESLHPRGDNMRYIEETLGFKVDIRNWDYQAEKLFHKALDEYGLKGEWIEERY
jgi:DNA repair photolyase